MQMARTTIAVEEVQDAGLPYIVVARRPDHRRSIGVVRHAGRHCHRRTRRGVIGFAGARVIEQTIREKLPEGFQRAEYLLDHGMIDMVVHRRDLRDTLIRALSLLRNPRPAAEIVEFAEVEARARGTEQGKEVSPGDDAEPKDEAAE